MRGLKTIWVNNCNGQTYKIELAKNQKVVKVNRIKNGINFEANNKALATLSANAYVLYMYLLLHSPNRVWALSSKDVYSKTPLAERTYTKAIDELISKGYLVEKEIDVGDGKKYKENSFILFEDPSQNLPAK